MVQYGSMMEELCRESGDNWIGLGGDGRNIGQMGL